MFGAQMLDYGIWTSNADKSMLWHHIPTVFISKWVELQLVCKKPKRNILEAFFLQSDERLRYRTKLLLYFHIS